MRSGEVATRVGVTVKALRYYESLGLVVPRRLPNGYRDYDELDVRLLREVRELTQLGIPVERTRAVLDCLTAGRDTVADCPAAITTYRQVIAELTSRLDVLEARRAVLLERLAQHADQPGNDPRDREPAVAELQEAAGQGQRQHRSVDWRAHGVQVVPPDRRDPHTAQTPGMHREAAVGSRTGATALWAGTVTIEPDARTGAHHHGDLESVIYVVSGRARMRWGDRLEFTAEAGPGSFVFVPPYVPHQEMNASGDEPLHCVLARSGQQPVVVALDIDGVADPEDVPWRDSLHLSDGA